MTQRNWLQGLAMSLVAAGLVWTSPAFGQRTTIFSENFDGLTLGTADDENLPAAMPNSFTHTPPTGWTVDNSQMPAGGMTEWAGWSFANPLFWSSIDGDGREVFAQGTGNVIAVADSDSWDDKSHADGTMNTFLKTPAISLAGVTDSDLGISFDSSWRAEGGQEAFLSASFDGGAPVEIFRWTTDTMPDANPSFESYSFNKPAGAQNVQLTFGYVNADNNWWWAVDNIAVATPTRTLLSQDFESVQTGPHVDELTKADPAWTPNGPAGWTVDRSGVPGIGDDATDGVTEWAGWSFADKRFWVGVAGDQDRSQFTKGANVVAVADPDEWDDAAHSPSAENGWYKTGMKTPAIDISQLKPGTVQLKFDNTWRPEFDSDFKQSAKIRVSIDGADPVDLATWLSSEGGQTTIIKDGGETMAAEFDLINSTETFAINTPEGAKSMVVEWYMFDAGNDWWWAIDNVEVSGESSGVVTFACGDFDKDKDVDSSDLLGFLGNWTGDAPGSGKTLETGDCDTDGDVDSADLLGFLANWTGSLNAEGSAELAAGAVGPVAASGAAVASVPEPSSAVLVLMGLGLTLLGRRRQG